jgi:hypothetical protein
MEPAIVHKEEVPIESDSYSKYNDFYTGVTNDDEKDFLESMLKCQYENKDKLNTPDHIQEYLKAVKECELKHIQIKLIDKELEKLINEYRPQDKSISNDTLSPSQKKLCSELTELGITIPNPLNFVDFLNNLKSYIDGHPTKIQDVENIFMSYKK